MSLTVADIGIVGSLRRLLSDTDPVVRMKTTEVLFIMAGKI